MKERILTDVDGVLLDWVAGIRQFLIVEKGYQIEPEKLSQGFYVSDWIDVDREEASRLVAEFHHSDYFKKLSAINNSQETLKKLAQQDYRFVAVTACLNPFSLCEKTIWQNRMDNLSALYGDIFDDIEMVCVHKGCKSDALKKFDATWWVEDLVQHALVGDEIGHKAIIMNSPYYKFQLQQHNLPIVESWDEIYHMINTEKDVD